MLQYLKRVRLQWYLHSVLRKNAAVFTRSATADNFCLDTCWQVQNCERDDQETREYCSRVVESKTEILIFVRRYPRTFFFFFLETAEVSKKKFRDFYRFFLSQLQNTIDYQHWKGVNLRIDKSYWGSSTLYYFVQKNSILGRKKIHETPNRCNFSLGLLLYGFFRSKIFHPYSRHRWQKSNSSKLLHEVQ